MSGLEQFAEITATHEKRSHDKIMELCEENERLEAENQRLREAAATATEQMKRVAEKICELEPSVKPENSEKFMFCLFQLAQCRWNLRDATETPEQKRRRLS
jgi:predicted nuclease with TOPRIM domain